jgi:DNA-binding CsgD family transcriptional regulator
MISPFDETPAEKEENVLDMIKGGYSYPQIMKACHVSPNTITRIKRECGLIENDTSITSKITKETQALKMFGEGKGLFQVATELDIYADDVFVIYQKFQRLRNNELFISMYEHVKGNMHPFFQLFDIMNGLGMTPMYVGQLAALGTRLPHLGNIYSNLCRNVQILESQRRNLLFQQNCAQNQLEQLKASLEFYNMQCEMKRNELDYLDSEINYRKAVIENLDNDDKYVSVKEAAKQESKLLMQNNQVILAVTLTATLEAIRRYPNNQMLISDIVASRCYSPTPYHTPWLDSHTPELLQLMHNVQDEMAEQLAKKSVNILEINHSESKLGVTA